MLVIGCFAVAGSTSHAQSTSFSIESVGGQIGLGNADLKEVIYNIIRWALGILTLVAVVYMMYGGYVWLTAAGNEQRVEKAKQIILQAAIGLVIVLLAWAIVFFVAKTVFNGTTASGPGGPGGGCVNINNCPGGQLTSFDATAVNTCAVPVGYQDVPRSSAVSITFNTDIKTSITAPSMNPPQNIPPAQDPVKLAVAAGDLQIQKCVDAACSNTISPNPKPIDNQVYTPGGATAGTKTAPLAEWLAINNTLTFYHLSFSDVVNDPANRLFEASTTYRVSIPKDTTNNSLKDVRDRLLSYCRSNPASIGNDVPNCTDSSDGKSLQYTFTTGTDTSGPPLKVTNTVPSSDYLTVAAAAVDRNVPRSEILGINFNGGIDPATVTTANFRVYKISAPSDPNKGTCGGGPCTGGTQLAANSFDIRVNSGGTGAWLQLKNNALFDSFIWYRVEVENMRNLCGTAAPKQTWLFETNDVTPGVQFVYPEDGNILACPNTEVFAQFKTSMWDITAGTTCHVGQANSFNTRALVYDTTAGAVVNIRSFDYPPAEQPPAGSTDPNSYCKRISFDPTTALLSPAHVYNIGVTSTRVVDPNGNTLEYGSAVPGFTPKPGTPPWHFTPAPANACANAPYIQSVVPNMDANGACISVQGNYFEKPTETVSNGLPEPGDSLKFDIYSQTNTEIKSWTNTSIVNRLNSNGLAAGTYQYQVSVNYPTPIGLLPSNKYNFNLVAGAASNRPCLFSLNPNQGLPSSTFSATGENFGTNSGLAQIRTDNATPWTPGPWNDTLITGITVPVSPPVQTRPTQVQVVNSAGVASNPLSFNVLSPTIIPTGTPALVTELNCAPASSIIPSPNPKDGDTTACRNTKVQARFSLNIDPVTASTSVFLDQCPAAGCAGGPYTAVGGSSTAVGQIVSFTPAANLTRNTWYRVTIKSTLKATAADGGKNLASDVVWTFKTIDSPDLCQVDNVVIAPPGPMLTNNANYGFQGLTASPTDAACHVLNTTTLSFDWAETNTSVGILQPTPITNTIATKSLTQPAGGVISAVPITTTITVKTENKTSPPFAFTYDPIGCTTSSQCVTNGLGQACGTPACINGKCQPVIVNVDKNNGPIGSWPTIYGCWLDNTPGTVKFFDNKDGLVPDAALCGSGTWTNNFVIREVPDVSTAVTTDDAAAGAHPVTVIRSDGVTATYFSSPGTTDQFNVTTATLGPLLCKVVPNTGKNNDPTTLTGHGFGASQQAGDNVTFQQGATTLNTLPPTSWAVSSIQANVPSASPVGTNFVRLVKGALSSNSVPYDIQAPSSCTVSCLFPNDATCPAGQACSYPGPNGLGCCGPKPKVTTVAPPNGSTQMCRNAITTVNFDQPLDGSTVTPSTVRYYDGSLQLNGSINVANTLSTGAISYNPGPLMSNSPQKLVLTQETSVPLTVSNPNFDTTDGSGLGNTPQDWNTAPGSTQSTDSHSGPFSALVDCRSSSPCTGQSFVYQDIPTSIIPLSSTDTFRVSGYIKVLAAGPTPGEVGFKAQCGFPPFSVSSCGYDTSGIVVTSPNPSWQYISFLTSRSFGRQQPLRITCYANPGAAVLCDDITLEKITPSNTTAIRSSQGVLADISFPAAGSNAFTYSWSTGANYCAIDTIGVYPSADLFTAKGEVHGPPTVPDPRYTATAYALGGTIPISPVISGSTRYTWDWSWLSGNTAIATVAQQGTTPTAAVTAVANGRTTVTAQAKITADTVLTPPTVGRIFQGQSDVSVQVCDNPWQLTAGGPIGFTDAAGNCDVTAGGCSNNFNFNLFYCRDGTALLPNFIYTGNVGSPLGSIEGINAADPTRLKSYFFKESKTSRDTIGLLIFQNNQFLSPYDWFTQRFPLDTGGASTTVAGYPAVKSGTTTYIGVTNLNGGTLEGLMFVFDYNSNSASPETVSIANQMLNTLVFNTNFLNADDKAKLVRDTKRMQDLRSLKIQLDQYKTKNGAYPSLTSGSYIPGFSTSVWPSWQATLGTTLGKTIPTDPTNAFSVACVAPYEAKTCWSETDKKFTCPTGTSNVYAYRTNTSSTDVYATMEYTGPGKFTSAPGSGICTAPSSCDCFGYKLHVGP